MNTDLRTNPMRWPVVHGPDGTSSVQMPDGRWLTKTSQEIADLLFAAVDEEARDWHLLVARRLAGEARFNEFCEIHSEILDVMRTLDA